MTPEPIANPGFDAAPTKLADIRAFFGVPAIIGGIVYVLDRPAVVEGAMNGNLLVRFESECWLREIHPLAAEYTPNRVRWIDRLKLRMGMSIA